MATRRKIALIYQYNENWIGGTYYIQNLISALNVVSDEKKPHLIILCEDDVQYNKLVAATGYPYIENRNIWKKLNIPARILNKISQTLFKNNFVNPYHVSNDVDMVVLQGDFNEAFRPDQKRLYWIPDFQERYLPEFFTKSDLLSRKQYQDRIAEEEKYIVFSSHVTKKDFDIFYPQHTLSSYVMQFAVTHPKSVPDERSGLLAQYDLPEQYYICSNQFWRHKNHKTVLEAIAILKQRGENILIAFTGKEHDSRYPGYFEELLTTVRELNIADQIKFLGFISREDQLALMKQSIAVIQPSLFEGWSTVVEDAKSLNVPIICSDLDVHQEQLENYEAKRFFSVSTGAPDLAEAISNHPSHSEKVYDYQQNILDYGNSLVKIIDNVLN